MKTKSKLLAVALIAGGTMFAQTRLSVGIGVGGYGPGAYPPPAYAQQYAPPCPGPGYTWVNGYWAPQGGRNVWIAGSWRAPVITQRYANTFRGNDRDRDHDRDRDRDRDRGERADNHGRDYSNGFRR